MTTQPLTTRGRADAPDETDADPSSNPCAKKKRKRRSWLLSLLGFGFASAVVMFLAAAGGRRLLRLEGRARSARL